MAENFKDIRYEIKNNIATITIDRPDKMNSVTAETIREIETALDMAGKDPQVGVIVFTGSGEKAFCAGADVSWQRQGKMGHTGPREFAPPHQTFSHCPRLRTRSGS